MLQIKIPMMLCHVLAQLAEEREQNAQWEKEVLEKEHKSCAASVALAQSWAADMCDDAVREEEKLMCAEARVEQEWLPRTDLPVCLPRRYSPQGRPWGRVLLVADQRDLARAGHGRRRASER